MQTANSSFLDTANSRETSDEIMEAILFVAGRSETEAARVWDSPTEAEQLAIWERVTNNGLVPADNFCWGASGSNWASDIESK